MTTRVQPLQTFWCIEHGTIKEFDGTIDSGDNYRRAMNTPDFNYTANDPASVQRRKRMIKTKNGWYCGRHFCTKEDAIKALLKQLGKQHTKTLLTRKQAKEAMEMIEEQIKRWTSELQLITIQ